MEGIKKEAGEMPESKDKVDTKSSSTSDDVAAELERTRAALKQANKEAAERRVKLEAYEKAEAEKQNADLTESQRLQKELDKIKADAESAQAKNRRYELERAISKAARAVNVEFASEDALSDAIALGVFGEIADDLSNAETVLKSVAKVKPYLFKSTEQQQEQRKGSNNGGNRNQKTPDGPTEEERSSASTHYARRF